MRAESIEAKGATAEETGVSDEAQPVPGASVSGNSGEVTSDKGFQSTPELPIKKKHQKRKAPSDI